jgi:hypothetical protein
MFYVVILERSEGSPHLPLSLLLFLPLRLPLAVLPQRTPKARVPHPSQPHREGWDRNPSPIQLLPLPVLLPPPLKICHLDPRRPFAAEVERPRISLLPVLALLPLLALIQPPKRPGCPILRSLIAKGGRVSHHPATTPSLLVLAVALRISVGLQPHGQPPIIKGALAPGLHLPHHKYRWKT